MCVLLYGDGVFLCVPFAISVAALYASMRNKGIWSATACCCVNWDSSIVGTTAINFGMVNKPPYMLKCLFASCNPNVTFPRYLIKDVILPRGITDLLVLFLYQR